MVSSRPESGNVVTCEISAADVTSLAKLAEAIGGEHRKVEDAARDGLWHACEAGKLLENAKASVPHGNWQAWVEANCPFALRTARLYMQVAEHWPELRTKVLEDGTGWRVALKALGEESAPDSKTAQPCAVLAPPALAYYHDKGLLDDDALSQLLALADDYGPEILTALPFSRLDLKHLETIGDVWALLNTIRPLDNPPLWPIVPEQSTAAAATVLAASRLFLEDGTARGGNVPQWEVAAFWFGSTMVYLAGSHPAIGKDFAHHLSHNLRLWRESFRTALALVGWGRARVAESHGEADWFGYLSDLRHAGISIFEEGTQLDSHPCLFKSMDDGQLAIIERNDYPAPSHMQRLPKKLFVA
jgi:hypothetical protein